MSALHSISKCYQLHCHNDVRTLKAKSPTPMQQAYESPKRLPCLNLPRWLQIPPKTAARMWSAITNLGTTCVISKHPSIQYYRCFQLQGRWVSWRQHVPLKCRYISTKLYIWYHLLKDCDLIFISVITAASCKWLYLADMDHNEIHLTTFSVEPYQIS